MATTFFVFKIVLDGDISQENYKNFVATYAVSDLVYSLFFCSVLKWARQPTEWNQIGFYLREIKRWDVW